MPSEERDRQFERALKRHLRADAACPDAETLAAYHERTLSMEELTGWKEHISGCARCQQVLALVEETHAVVLNDWEAKEQEKRSAPVLMASASRTNFEVTENANLAAAPSAVRVISSPQQKTVTRPKAWRWVLPAGAVAAGLLVFVAVRENTTQKLAPVQSSQMAENRKAEVPPASPVAPAQELPQSQDPLDKKIEPGLPKSVLGNQGKRKPDSPISRDEMAAILNGATSSGTTNARSATQGLRAELDSGVRANGTQAESDAKKSATPPQSDVNASAMMSAGTANAPVTPAPVPSARSAETSAATAGVAGTLRKSEDSAIHSQVVGSVEVQAEQKPVQPSKNYMQLRHIAAANPHVILAPDGKRVWRVGAAGIIESSNDSGITWKTQQSGVNVDLSAGSAPSDRVSWVVGKAGTILLTTDGGEHWKLIVSPLQEDLGGVHAVDARNASIWDVSNQKSFATADGGMTWTAAANE